MVEGPNVTELRLFKRGTGDLETIFGHQNRTMANLMVAAIGAADPTAIARTAGVDVKADMLRLMDPIEADGLVTSEMGRVDTALPAD